MTAPRDPDRLIRAFFKEGLDELPDPVYDVVRSSIEQTRQRAAIGPWRISAMNRYLKYGLAAAAVVVIAVIGFNLLPGSPGPGGEPSATPAASVEPSEPAPSAWVGVPAGPFLWFDPTNPPGGSEFDDGPPITITITASGWTLPDWEGLEKGDQVDNVPESWLLYASTTAGILVYGDPCRWVETTPDTPATTADEVVAALAAQPSRDASEPVDVTLGGYAGRMITLHVPDDAVFSDCDTGAYASYELEGQDGVPWRLHQGPGQIDEFWVVDVDGDIVIINAAYRPDTSTQRIEEMHTMIESATFEVP